MRKSLFLLGLTVATLSSCTQSEVLEVAGSNKAIGFDAFVNKSIRADITTDNINHFKVFGGYDGNYTNVFNDEKVSGSKGSWTYDNTQYWTNGKTYTFQAYAPEGATASATANGVNFTGFAADGKTDLLVSGVKTVSEVNTASDPEKVQFSFRHVLSKIKFTFSTTLNNVNIAISDLKVQQVPNTGNYTNSGSTGSWGSPSGTKDYDLTVAEQVTKSDAKSSSEIIVMPQTFSQGLTVSFKVTVTGGLSLTADHTVTLPTTAWEEGKCYNYKAELTPENIDPLNPLKPVEFGDPTVDGWEPFTDDDVTVAPQP